MRLWLTPVMLCACAGAAELVGKKIGELCLAKNISTVSFDRGGNVYHGRVKVGLLSLPCHHRLDSLVVTGAP